jgi:putative monooxygenase
MSEYAPRKVANGDVAPSVRRGGEIRALLTPASVGATDGFSGTITVDPGDFLSEHYHPYSDKFLYLARGRLTLRIEGEEVELCPDEALMVRRGQRHRIENRHDEQALIVYAICPLAPSPALGHVDTEPVPNPDAGYPTVHQVHADGALRP